MPVSQACFVVMKLCEGLDYAHNKRDQSGRELSLVHRDVSPQNVLVSFEGEVKIIDFGIAKAAGKGSKTQAGILKGKFGYMSPEQVRGLPVDRRSDVFSCGIVLYELLTGERLFVGESDFSTLEKVRNVEILPPSTYNRKIPDELERIVLKALAKDVEDRYQNAIDLHDELQAFVYTAGEFYSRKDLAGWMKKTFGREIEEETAKLESYRQLKAPASRSATAARRTPTGSRPTDDAAHRALAIRVAPRVRNKAAPPPPAAGRVSQQMPVVKMTRPATQPVPARSTQRRLGGLAWDDDELETQIYDNPRRKRRSAARSARGSNKSGGMPVQRSRPPPPQPARRDARRAPLSPQRPGPDLSSLGLDRARLGRPKATNPGTNGLRLAAADSRSRTARRRAPAHARRDPLDALAASYTSAPSAALPAPTPRQPDPMFDPMASFGSGMLRQQGLARARTCCGSRSAAPPSRSSPSSS
jgi:hypothetical protein